MGAPLVPAMQRRASKNPFVPAPGLLNVPDGNQKRERAFFQREAKQFTVTPSVAR